MKQINENLWIQADGENYLIGLTEDLLEETGDINFASIAELGSLEQDDVLVELEASKAVIELVIPFAAEVIDRNVEADNDPSVLNSTDASKNWLVKVKNISATDLEALKLNA